LSLLRFSKGNTAIDRSIGVKGRVRWYNQVPTATDAIANANATRASIARLRRERASGLNRA
jgi:hypothetical protein